MAKIKTYIITVCLVLLSVSAGISGSLTRNCVHEQFTQYVGIREATGRNDGTMVEYFQHMAGVRKGDAWCAAFVYTCIKQCDSSFVLKAPAWSSSWFTTNVIWKQGRGQTPQTADVFGIYFLSKKRIAHVGFIESWPDGKYTFTVEGNTNEAGSREGDGVYRKRRLKAQIYTVSKFTK